jgi:predicted ATPase
MIDRPMLTTLAIANYRSIRQIVLPLGRLTVVTGANGSGKSNLYRALRLLSDTARGGIIGTLAREGGFDSTLWAGPETLTRGMKTGAVRVEGGPRREPVNLRLGFCDDSIGYSIGYSIDIGLPPPAHPPPQPPSPFSLDPEIKRECIFAAPKYHPRAVLVDRRNAAVRLRNDSGEWSTLTSALQSFDTMLTELNDPKNAPEISALRDTVRGWRFYDHFRVDGDAPARQPVVATRTPVLAADGRDLVAALETIREIGARAALEEAIDDAFPGARIASAQIDGRLKLEFSQPGLLRPLSAAELSDGTLRYLLWAAALMTPRPPPLMVLNEPETSLHPDLLPALGRLISHAARDTQVWVVSHASRLVATLREDADCNALELDKELGETVVRGRRALDEPDWSWPER